MALWRSAGAAWTEAFCSGLVPDAAEAQLRTIARYNPPGGTSVDNFLHHMLQLGEFLLSRALRPVARWKEKDKKNTTKFSKSLKIKLISIKSR